VTVNPLVTCGTCAACRSGRENLCADRQIISMPPREGAFAQFLAMPERNLVECRTIRLDQAALAEPIACGWHAVRLGNARCKPLDGCPRSGDRRRCHRRRRGAVAQGAGRMETSRWWSPMPRRRSLSRARQVKLSMPEPEDGADAVRSDRRCGRLCADARGVQAAVPGGVIVHIGLGAGRGGLDIRRMTLQEITFIGTYTYTAQDFRDTAPRCSTVALARSTGPRSRPLGRAQAAFADFRAARSRRRRSFSNHI
jgi:threonine dehydrogenase-like Zn-dependent dehydrogenase